MGFANMQEKLLLHISVVFIQSKIVLLKEKEKKYVLFWYHCEPPGENRVRGIKCFQSSQSYLFLCCVPVGQGREANIKGLGTEFQSQKVPLEKKVNTTASSSTIT